MEPESGGRPLIFQFGTMPHSDFLRHLAFTFLVGSLQLPDSG
jgi:hypothetical protein